MKHFLLLVAAIGVWLGWIAAAYAAPVLLTLSEAQDGVTQTWWPSQPGQGRAVVDAFSRYGLDVVDPEQMSNAPRLSPTVYGPKPLSSANAHNLALLFGASNALNGELNWQCESASSGVSCTLKANAALTGKDSHAACSRSFTIHAPSAELAKKILINQYAAECSPEFLQTRTTQGGIPALIDKPVIVFDPIPDADTLVALRKQIKRVEGVQDVAERWIAKGMLAIEINPGQKELSQTDFSRIIQGLANEKIDNLIIRLTRQDASGATFEVVRY